MQITTMGAQTPIFWNGGFGTISLTDTSALEEPELQAGAYNGATVTFEASFDQGAHEWDAMVDADGAVVTFDSANKVRNFSLSPCKIRAVVATATPSGRGIKLGINKRG